jgi:hypothetical protein
VWFNRSLALLVILNVVALVAESVEEIQRKGGPFFYGLEALSSTVFLLEHIGRVWTITESKAYRKYKNPSWARAWCVRVPDVPRRFMTSMTFHEVS